MKKLAVLLAAILCVLSGCAAQMNSSTELQKTSSQTESSAAVGSSEEEMENADVAESSEEATLAVETENTESEDTMRLLIGETEVPVTWEENASVEALKALSPVTIQMSMYGGFEQVGPIGQSIVHDDVQTNTSYGDIVLYSGNQIVIFYGSNSWAYTRLGHVELTQQEMRDLLGRGDVAITFE